MNSLISIFVVFAMLLSGAYSGEDPMARSSMISTIDNVVLSINDQTFSLNPSIRFGAVTEGETALMDFAVPCGNEDLFPIQARFDPSGISLLIGDSNTVYTFSSAIFDAVSGIDDMDAFIDSYSQLLRSSASLQRSAAASPGFSAEAEEAILALAGDVVTESATFSLNGQEIAGEQFSFSLSHDQMMQLVDASMQLSGEEFLSSYYGYLNSVLSMADPGVSIDSFADLCDLVGLELTAQVDGTGNGSCGIVDMMLNITVAEGNASIDTDTGAVTYEPVSVSLPASVTVFDEDTAEFYMPMHFDDMGLYMDLYILSDGPNMTMTLSMPDNGTTATFGMNMQVLSNADGSVYSVLDYVFNLPGAELELFPDSSVESFTAETASTRISMHTENTLFADMTQSGSLAFEVASAGSTALAFSMDIASTRAEITDRIAQASNTVVFNSAEEVSENSSILMAIMALAGDVEKLLSDPSVDALADALYALDDSASIGVIGGADGPTSVIISDSETDMETTIVEPSFTVPEFPWLPEGYVLSERTDFIEGDAASLYYTFAEDESRMFEIYVSAYDNSGYTHYVLKDDKSIEPIGGSPVFICHGSEYNYAYCECETADVYVYDYGRTLSDSDFFNIFANMQ